MTHSWQKRSIQISELSWGAYYLIAYGKLNSAELKSDFIQHLHVITFACNNIASNLFCRSHWWLQMCDRCDDPAQSFTDIWFNAFTILNRSSVSRRQFSKDTSSHWVTGIFIYTVTLHIFMPRSHKQNNAFFNKCQCG